LEELGNDLAYGIDTLRTRVEHAAAEKKLEYLAHHDVLTGLPNRLLLRDRFDQAIVQALHEDSGVTMFFLDLDNFKQVNDSLGHNYGDLLLVQVVKRLGECLRDTDTISRQGGDEFVVLLPNLHDLSVINEIANHIVEAFSAPFEIGSYSINTTFSIGISVYPDDGVEFDTLLKNSDTALYQAKDSGRDTYRFFSAKMNIDAQEQLQLQGQLRHAVKNQEFVLHYQPQIDIISGHIIGAEALVRWQHPEQGLIPPGKFIPLAERSGLIVPMGEWVLNEACRQAQRWRDNGLPLLMAVNLSSLQFKRGNLIETVVNALEKSGLPAELLELELTESILMQDVDVAIKLLHSLKEMGVKLSIDDFGTGYSSLSYLKRLAVNKLKIDQSFVRDLTEDANSAAIVRAIIQLGQTLQLTVIAEGVETDAQLAFLRNYGCDEVQGYLFSRPIPAADFVALLKK
jgi:diguanylate cyclase (GGDEF)-like protein